MHGGNTAARRPGAVGARRRAGAPFSLQGHRGAAGLRPENTLAAFAAALEVGVTALELDTGVTRDGVVVVVHDRAVSPALYADTGPALPGDPRFPYVGSRISDLTHAQLATLACGTRGGPGRGDAPRLLPGARIPTLAEVFELVQAYGADGVRFTVEMKVDPTAPADTLPPAAFARHVVAVVQRFAMEARTTLQSFDWRTLVAARRIAPGLRIAALASPDTVTPGGSPWMAGVELSAHDGDVAAAAAALGADVLAPQLGVGRFGERGWAPYLTGAMVRSAHRRGLAVVPWTLNAPDEMRHAIALGVDGLITDRPDRARRVLRALGIGLPPRHAAPDALAVA